ncbi:MAG TPA: hypothetical protein VFP97_04455 [Chitinophagaceae bacterium]|nr:hypothetical protein [Chitinophagaceae bacterium]
MKNELLFPGIIVFVLWSCMSHRASSINKNSMNLRADKGMSPTNKETRREELYALLGKLPDRHRPMSVKLISIEETDEMII